MGHWSCVPYDSAKLDAKNLGHLIQISLSCGLPAASPTWNDLENWQRRQNLVSITRFGNSRVHAYTQNLPKLMDKRSGEHFLLHRVSTQWTNCFYFCYSANYDLVYRNRNLQRFQKVVLTRVHSQSHYSSERDWDGLWMVDRAIFVYLSVSSALYRYMQDRINWPTASLQMIIITSLIIIPTNASVLLWTCHKNYTPLFLCSIVGENSWLFTLLPVLQSFKSSSHTSCTCMPAGLLNHLVSKTRATVTVTWVTVPKQNLFELLTPALSPALCKSRSFLTTSSKL